MDEQAQPNVVTYRFGVLAFSIIAGAFMVTAAVAGGAILIEYRTEERHAELLESQAAMTTAMEESGQSGGSVPLTEFMAGAPDERIADAVEGIEDSLTGW